MQRKKSQAGNAPKSGWPPPVSGYRFVLVNLIDKKQMAARLAVTPRTLENWMKLGYVPYIRIGRVVRYDLEEVIGTLKRRHGRNYGKEESKQKER